MNKKKPKKRPMIDLHGKTQDEVYDLIDRFLTKSNQQGHEQVHIMTGKGKGVVKKVAKEYLKQAGYPSKPLRNANGQINEGVLVVFLQ